MHTWTRVVATALIVVATGAVVAAPAEAGPPAGDAPLEVRDDGCGTKNIYLFGQPLFLHPMCPQP